MGLCQVPSEILWLIIDNLDPDDLLQLASTSRHFKHIIRDKFISRKALEVSYHGVFSTSLIFFFFFAFIPSWIYTNIIWRMFHFPWIIKKAIRREITTKH